MRRTALTDHPRDSRITVPPRAREPCGCDPRDDAYIRITSACSGSTVAVSRCAHGSADHPNVGEHVVCRQDHSRVRGKYAHSGSPPRALGIIFSRITPACAGNTDLDRDQRDLDRDHPRVRGEHTC